LVRPSEKQIITAELYVSVVFLGLVLCYIGLYFSRPFWDLFLRALFGWLVADGVADALERKTEGRFKVFKKRLPFPHRITVAYLFYPISIGVALLYGEMVTDMIVQVLPTLQLSSLLNLLSRWITGKALGHTQEFYVITASFLVSVILLRDFRSRTKKGQ
jgi:predicted PurR-regulated permease PerM